MPRRKINFPGRRFISVKLIVTITVIFLIIGFLSGYLKGIIVNRDYFTITDIMTNDKDIAIDKFSYLRGRNIFNLDLKKETRYAVSLYPDYQRVSIIRILPNRLFIKFTKRTPVAYVKLYRYFCVDEDSALFDAANYPNQKLPVILGLETKIFGPAAGRKYNIRELAMALDVIAHAKRNKIIRNFTIKNITVPSLGNASFLLSLPVKVSSPPGAQEYMLEIKISHDDIGYKFNLLGNLLYQARNDLRNIKYIDLRFKEPVIKFKDSR